MVLTGQEAEGLLGPERGLCQAEGWGVRDTVWGRAVGDPDGVGTGSKLAAPWVMGSGAVGAGGFPNAEVPCPCSPQAPRRWW